MERDFENFIGDDESYQNFLDELKQGKIEEPLAFFEIEEPSPTFDDAYTYDVFLKDLQQGKLSEEPIIEKTALIGSIPPFANFLENFKLNDLAYVKRKQFILTEDGVKAKNYAEKYFTDLIQYEIDTNTKKEKISSALNLLSFMDVKKLCRILGIPVHSSDTKSKNIEQLTNYFFRFDPEKAKKRPLSELELEMKEPIFIKSLKNNPDLKSLSKLIKDTLNRYKLMGIPLQGIPLQSKEIFKNEIRDILLTNRLDNDFQYRNLVESLRKDEIDNLIILFKKVSYRELKTKKELEDVLLGIILNILK
jgi:hypothetical protein